MHIYTHPHIHKSFSSNGLLLCDKRSGASSGPPTQQENQVMHLEMVRATDTNNYPGPWHTLVPKRSGDRYHCDLQILITKDYWHKQNLKDRKKEMFIRGPDSLLLTYTNQCWGNSASHITTMVPQLNNWWCTDPPANEPNSLISILGLNRWLGGQTQLCQSLRFEHPQHVHSGKGFMHTRSQWTQKDHQS